jgi:SAM-dependent methyltransferase
MTDSEALALEDRDCPLGCPRGDDFVLEGRDRLHGLPGRFRVVRCRSCGLLRTNPRPTPEAMPHFYPDDYGPHQSTVVGEMADDHRSALRRRLAAWLQKATDTRSHPLPDLPRGRLLEIGCASGAFLHGMAGKGWTVSGIEFSLKAAASARKLGYPVFAGPLEKAPDPSEPFDLVVGWMVLEHLHEPVLALERLRRWTRPGGWLVVSVPDPGAWEFRVFRDAWYALQVPTHLTLPSVPTLTRMLERTGWRLERVFHQRDLRNVMASLGYLLEDHGRAGRLAAWLRGYPERGGRVPYLLFPIAALLASMGQTGRMTIWARRQDA